ERIRPAVVRTAHLRSVAGGLSHYRCGVMTTSIKESVDLIVISAHDYDRLAGNFRRDVIARIRELIAARSDVPRAAEDRLLLQRKNPFVGIPSSRDRRGLVERKRGIVTVDLGTHVS